MFAWRLDGKSQGHNVPLSFPASENLDSDKASRLSVIDGGNDLAGIQHDNIALIVAQHDQRHLPALYILLILNVLVCRYHHIESRLFRRFQQCAVRQGIPFLIGDSADIVTGNQRPQAMRQVSSSRTSILARRYRIGAARDEIEDAAHLLSRYGGKFLHDFVNIEVFQVLENSGHWHARSAKYPRTADFPRYAFKHRALRPIKHDGVFFLSDTSENRCCR